MGTSAVSLSLPEGVIRWWQLWQVCCSTSGVGAVYKQWVHARRDALCRPLFYTLSVTPSDKDAAAAAEVNSTCRYCATPAWNAESISATAVNEDSLWLLRRKVCWASEILCFLESELLLSRNKLGGQQNWSLKGHTLPPTSFSESTFLHTIITASRIANSILAFLNKQHKTYNIYTFICDTVGY